MKEKFNQINYQNEYIREKYDRINLTTSKGKKEKIKKAAGLAGMSVNEWINHIIDTSLMQTPYNSIK